MKWLLVGTFFLSSVVGFAVNIMRFNQPQLLHGFFWPLLISSISTLVLLLRLSRKRWAIPLLVLSFGTSWLAVRFQASLSTHATPHNLQRELFFNAVGIMIGVGAGSRLLISFLTTQGAASVRMQTELALAHEIQSTLVPVISLRTSRFEVYGIPLPSTEMGGHAAEPLPKIWDAIHGAIAAYGPQRDQSALLIRVF